jgi:hypothetical protein
LITIRGNHYEHISAARQLAENKLSIIGKPARRLGKLGCRDHMRRRARMRGMRISDYVAPAVAGRGDNTGAAPCRWPAISGFDCYHIELDSSVAGNPTAGKPNVADSRAIGKLTICREKPILRESQQNKSFSIA